jgi:membrane-bound lytic murein transglycosylase B
MRMRTALGDGIEPRGAGKGLPACAFAIVALLAGLAAPAQALELAEYPELRTFIGEVAARHGFDAIELTRWFADVNLKTDVVAAMERPREALPYHEYRKGFLTPLHVKRGLDHWRQHAAALERARDRYGVPPEIVLGILGVETQYGRNNGKYRVLDALTTLMLLYPPRAEFFRRELEEFLVLARQLKLKPLDVKGSYAGAVGIAQFIPSSYRRYAVDHDGDGRADLLKSHADAIGSIASFLKVHGWQASEPVVTEARLEGTYYFWVEKLGVKPALNLRDLVGYGIFPSQPVDTEKRAALIELEGEDGPYYRLGFDNFYAITRYNRSKRYAMAVTELAELLRTQREGESAP